MSSGRSRSPTWDNRNPIPEEDTVPAAPLLTGAPCWIDLFSSDTAKATAFYGQLFGWSAEPADERFGGYFSFTKDGKQVAGCMLNDGQAGMPDAWTVYLKSPDIEATVAAAAANGGRVDLAPMEVHELGSMAMIGDPGQASVGVWQPGVHKGFETGGEIGTPAWFELHTHDYAASVDFYRDVFAWDTHVESDIPEFRYTTLGRGENARAGIMDASAFLPAGAPGAWSIYFRVADTDAALDTVVELGGAIVQPAEDSPYGRLAQAADPTGTPFRLIAIP